MHVQWFTGQYVVREKRISLRRRQRQYVEETCIILWTGYAYTTAMKFTSSIPEDEGSTFSLNVDIKVRYRKM